MDSLLKFETETYPRLWQLAYDAGTKARDEGLPRECNLKNHPHVHKGKALKVYKSAWEQGWDKYTIPEEFRQMEALLNQMPLRPLNSDDL